MESFVKLRLEDITPIFKMMTEAMMKRPELCPGFFIIASVITTLIDYPYAILSERPELFVGMSNGTIQDEQRRWMDSGSILEGHTMGATG